MTTKKEKRREEIEAVAYALLEEKGFEGTSMKLIAGRAHASMETLYNWYGDKRGLFSALVERNAARVLARLGAADAQAKAPDDRLYLTAVALLEMLTSPQAIALNRAAISDASGTLGGLLTQSGRAVVGPHLAELLMDWRKTGDVAFGAPREAAEVFVSLLVGDHQIRRATHAEAELTAEEIQIRAHRALRLFRRIYAPGAAPI